MSKRPKKLRMLYRYEDDDRYNGCYRRLSADDAPDYRTTEKATKLPAFYQEVTPGASSLIMWLAQVRKDHLPTVDFMSAWMRMHPDTVRKYLRELKDKGMVVAYSLVLRPEEGKNKQETIAYRLVTDLVLFDCKES